VACAAGITSAAGQSACSVKVCKAGYYSVGLTCVACVPGKYSHYASTSCTDCPVGTAQHKSAESSCPSCGAGSSQPKAGQATCVKNSMLFTAMEAVAQSSAAELAVGAVAALAVVGTVLAGVVVAFRKAKTPGASVEEMQPLMMEKV